MQFILKCSISPLYLSVDFQLNPFQLLFFKKYQKSMCFSGLYLQINFNTFIESK